MVHELYRSLGRGHGPAAGPRGRGRRLAGLALALALAGGDAGASKPRCRLERVDVVPGTSPTQLRVLASLVELEGNLQTLPASAFQLEIGGKAVGKAEAATAVSRAGIETYMVLALETSALYKDTLEKIKEAVGDFLEALPPTVHVQLQLFGNELVAPNRVFGNPGALRSSLDEVEPDDEGEIQLVNGLRAGLRALNTAARPAAGKAQDPAAPPPRRIIVVLSDGINPVMERGLFRRLGDDLRKNNVALFPIAFSPRDDRGPLLNLGELAKRSGGTFRWAQKPDDLKDRFLSLAEELKQLQVLTFSGRQIDADALAKAALALRCGETRSAGLSLDGGALPPPAGGGWLRWVLGILGVLAGLYGAARLVSYLLDRRVAKLRQKLMMAQGVWPGQPGMPGVPGQPGMPGQAAQSAAAWPGQPAAQSAAWPGQQPAAQSAAAWPGQQPAAQSSVAPQPVVAQPRGTLPAQQPQAPSTAGASQVAAPGRRPVLAFVGRTFTGQRFPLPESGALALGKAVSGPGTLLIPSDPTVSSRHAEIRRLGSDYYFSDLGSTNGSYINDNRVTAPTRLSHGDLIRIGTGTECRFLLE